MRKIREILRLSWDLKVSANQISASVNVARGTVQEYLRRAVARGLPWPLPDDMDDVALEHFLYDKPKLSSGRHPQPDWSYINRELRRPGVNLQLLWFEYKQQYPDGYEYSQFCLLHSKWKKTLSLTMRQEHHAGEKMFVDFAGQTIPVTNRDTGEVRQAHLFVAVLGASNYTFAECNQSEDLAAWISGHVHAFEYFGGTPKIVVPDNPKVGVTNANFFEPELNMTYHQMALHYGVAVIPARPRKPKDKAKVEKGVQFAETWLLAILRNRQFFSLSELNKAINELLEMLNNRPFKKLEGSRRSWFESLDKPALNQLPHTRYEYAQWRKSRVHPDYHIDAYGHYYSVPYQLVGQQLDIRITDTTIECFYKNKRIASHVRHYKKGMHTTIPEHMPKSHREYAGWSPDKFITQAKIIGPATTTLIEHILTSRQHLQQGFRASFGILRLTKEFTPERLEAACKRALLAHAYSYKSIKSILKNGLDKQTLLKPIAESIPITHPNIRGSNYYS